MQEQKKQVFLFLAVKNQFFPLKDICNNLIYVFEFCKN